MQLQTVPGATFHSTCSCLCLCLLSAFGCDSQWCAQTAPKCGSFEGAVQGAVLPAISTVLTASDNGRTPLDALSEAVPSLLQVSSMTNKPQHSSSCCVHTQKSTGCHSARPPHITLAMLWAAVGDNFIGLQLCKTLFGASVHLLKCSGCEMLLPKFLSEMEDSCAFECVLGKQKCSALHEWRSYPVDPACKKGACKLHSICEPHRKLVSTAIACVSRTGTTNSGLLCLSHASPSVSSWSSHVNSTNPASLTIVMPGCVII